jgi:hypothetical protein
MHNAPLNAVQPWMLLSKPRVNVLVAGAICWEGFPIVSDMRLRPSLL